MTSAAEPSLHLDPAPVIWITGLAGVGKSMLALEVAVRLRSLGLRPLILDGDAVRDALEAGDGNVVHDRPHRLQRAWRIAKLARIAAAQEIPVIVATISLFHCIHDWNRRHMPVYCEVLLEADRASLTLRRPELYGAQGEAAVSNVVGIDITPEYPVAPALTIAQRFRIEDLPVHAAAVVALIHRGAAEA